MATKSAGRRLLPFLLALALVVAYLAAWQWDLLPRETIAIGTVMAKDGKVLQTRQFYRTSRDNAHKSAAPGPAKREAAWEVRLPSGRWIDCDGDDCLAAYERSVN